jgi:serine/threonine protein kinase/WD40 repeat protein
VTDESLFHHALAIPDPAARSAFLERECPDRDRRARLELLLAGHKGDSLPGPHAMPPDPTTTAAEHPATATTHLPAGVTGTHDPDRTTDLRSGDPEPSGLPCIAGYEVLAVLGEGGMGVVFKAVQTAVGRVVALKMIRGGFGSPGERARFRAEAEAAGKLTHPGIVQVYEVGECAGFPYFTLEFCDGGSLAQRLDGSPWHPRAAARLAEMLAGAVGAAHARGIVHRDLKPANVLLVRLDAGDGGTDTDPAARALLGAALREPGGAFPKVTDFGISKRLDSPAGPTATGAVMGTPSYMSPEQARGDSKAVGPAADVWALGAILYELLTGRPPFKARGVVETLDLVRNQEPVAVRALNPACPRDLETICLKCLQKDPGKRYTTAAALADDLRRFREQRPILARPVGPAERAWRWCRRNPVVAGSLAAILAVGAGAFAAVLVALDRERTQRGIAEWKEQLANEATEEAKQKTRDEAAARVRERNAKIAAQDAQAEESKAKARAIAAGQREAEERKAADAARDLAVARRRQAETALYSTQLNDALRHLLDNNPVLARQTLDACRWDLRGWEWYHLRAMAEGSTHTLTGHTDLAGAITFSPDGKRLLTAGQDGRCKLWDTWTGREVADIPVPHALGPRGPYLFSRDGRYLLLPGADRTVVQYEAATGRAVRSHPWAPADLQRVAFSPDSRFIAAVVRPAAPKDGAPRHTVSLTRSDDGKTLLTADVTGAFTGLGFSADGRCFAASCAVPDPAKRAAPELRVWEVGKQGPRVLKDFVAPLAGWALSGDGRRVATVTHVSDAAKRTAGSRVQLWELGGAEPKTLHEQHAPVAPDGRSQSQVIAIAPSPDGRRVATVGLAPEGKGSFRVEARVHDFETGEELSAAKWDEPQPGATRLLFFSPDGTRLVVGSWSEFNPRISPPPPNLWVRLIDPATGKVTATVREVAEVRPSISGDGARIVTFGGDPKFANLGELRVWDVSRGEIAARLRGHTGVVFGSAVTPDGHLVASASFDGTVKLWDLSPGRGQPVGMPAYPFLSGTRNGERVVAVDESRDPKVPDGAGRRALKVWDYGTAAPRVIPVEDELRGRFLTARGVVAVGRAVAPWDGSLAASAVLSAPPPRFVGHLRANVSPDGRWVAATFENNPDATRVVGTSPVWVYDAASGKLLYQVPGHAGAVASRVFSPDGARLAVVNGSFRREIVKGSEIGLRDYVSHRWQPGVLAVYDAATGQECFQIPAERHDADAVAFSPDGRHLITYAGEWASAFDPSEGRLPARDARRHRLWDARTGELVYTLPEGAKGMMFSPEGRRLAYFGRAEGMVEVLDLESRKVLARVGPVHHLLTVSPDGRHLVANVGPRRMQMWEADTGKELTLFRNQPATHATISPLEGARRPGRLDALRSFVTFAPGGERLLYEDGTGVGVFDPATGFELVRIPADRVFTPTELLCVRQDYSGRKTLSFREYQAFRPRPPRPLGQTIQHTLADFDVEFTADGRRLVAARPRGWNSRSLLGQPFELSALRQTNQITAWDLTTGQEALAVHSPPRGTAAGAKQHAFSADGLRLAELDSRKVSEKPEWETEISVTDLARQVVIARLKLPHSVTAPVLSPDGTRLAAVVSVFEGAAKTTRRELRVWAVEGGKELRAWPLPEKASVAGVTLRFSPDGGRLALASDAAFGTQILGKKELVPEVVLLWDVATGGELLRHEHTHRVRDVAFGKDGKSLAWISAVVEPVRQGLRPPGAIGPNPFDKFEFNRLRITSLELKSWGEGGGVKAFPLRVDVAPPPPGPFETRIFEEENVRVAFAPDGSRVALVHARRVVKVWDTATGEELAVLPAQAKDVHCLAFSPDGTRLATVAQTVDTSPMMPDLDLGPGITLHSFVGITEAQRAPEVRLWELSTRRVLLTARPHLDRVESVAFAPTGNRLATASRDGTIKLCELPP